MKLKNISKETQLTQTIDGTKEVKSWEIFETNEWKTLLNSYSDLFEKVDENEVVEKKTATKKK